MTAGVWLGWLTFFAAWLLYMGIRIYLIKRKHRIRRDAANQAFLAKLDELLVKQEET